MPDSAIAKHWLVLGAPGTGKSVLLKYLIRQAIANGDPVVLMDPHAELYTDTLSWLQASGFAKLRQVHLIDPGNHDYVTGFNSLEGFGAHPSVTADSFLKGVERAFGDKDINDTPQIARLLRMAASALAELGLALSDILLLLDPVDGGDLRLWAVQTLTDSMTRYVLRDYDRLCRSSPKDARQQFEGPLNRATRFLAAEVSRLALGRTEATLNLVECMDEGHIILANLAGNQHIGQDTATFMGILLLKELVEKAKGER